VYLASAGVTNGETTKAARESAAETPTARAALPVLLATLMIMPVAIAATAKPCKLSPRKSPR
jgi:hypothetical protein